MGIFDSSNGDDKYTRKYSGPWFRYLDKNDPFGGFGGHRIRYLPIIKWNNLFFLR
jgi:hypothetical protein